MQQRVRAALEQLGYEADRPLWLAVSGGADSIALLHATVRLGLQVEVFHLNHQARPEADQDAQFVVGVCQALQVPVHVESVDVPGVARQQGVSFETAARRVRYDKIEHLALGGQAATGHTMDDQAETVLLRLLRGAGARGLAGIRPRLQRGCTIFRPLLGLRSTDLRTWLQSEGLPWREDSTNTDTRVARNRIRHELLPLLATYNPAIVDALYRTATVMLDDDDYLETLAQTSATGDWRSLSPALRRRLLRHVPGLEAADLQQVLALEQLPPGRRYHLGSRDFEWQTGRLAMVRPNPQPWGPQPLAWPGETEVAGYRIEVSQVLHRGPNSRHEVFLRPDCVPLEVRSRRDGDRFHPPGSGHKKLKKFFIDEKVPRNKRDSIPLLVTPTGAVVWVVGWQVDRGFFPVPGQDGAWRVRIAERS